MFQRFFFFIFNKLTSCQFYGFRGKCKYEPLSLQRLTMSGFGDTDQFVNWGKKGCGLALRASPKTHFVTFFGSGGIAKLLFFRGFGGSLGLCGRFCAVQWMFRRVRWWKLECDVHNPRAA
jgi:hypothetical protein